MKPRAIRVLLLAATAAALVAPVSRAARTPSARSGVAVVVHADTPVDDLSFAEVRKIFLGERQYWNKDLPVVLVVRAPNARERDVVLKRVYEMTEAQFKQYWIAKIFRDEATSAPKVVYSNEMLNNLVAAVPGAIGLVNLADVGEGMKIIRVDGHRPNEPGYPLR